MTQVTEIKETNNGSGVSEQDRLAFSMQKTFRTRDTVECGVHHFRCRAQFEL